MAEFLQCTEQHYQRIEYGMVNISMLDLTSLALLLGATTDYLCGLDFPDGPDLIYGSGIIHVPQVDSTGDIIFEYERGGEKATLRFPRNATAKEIQQKINQFLPLLKGLGLTDERER